MSMEIYPMSKVNLSSSVKNYLYQYIRSLEQTGNMKLPPESELSLKLGVSRVRYAAHWMNWKTKVSYCAYKAEELLQIRKH